MNAPDSSATPAAPEDPTLAAIAAKMRRLDELQTQEDAGRRRSVRVAWLSVAAAALVLAAIFAAFGARIAQRQAELAALGGQLAQQDRQLAGVNAALAAKQQELAATDQKLAALRAQAQAYQLLVDQLKPTKDQLEAAAGTAPPGAVAPAQLLPRAYLQIVDAADRAWAGRVAAELRQGGTLVPGIELVAGLRTGLRSNQVRYYKAAERPGAQRIADRLQALGIETELVHLEKYEHSTAVRANHFEVWFKAGVRETALR